MSYFTDQINDQEKGNIFFPAIRKVRRAEIETRKKDFHWGYPDYKLYPSSIKSWTICPKKHIESQAKYSGIDSLDGVYRTRRGSAIHEEIQKDFLSSDRLAPEPNLSKLDKRMKVKLAYGFPEVPFHDFETGFSGSVDAVMQLRGGEIIPVEIKSTGMLDDDWNNAILNDFPRTMNQWIIQLCNYIYHLNKAEYYNTKISRGVLAIINSRDDAASPEAEKEYIIEYSKYREKIEELIKHLSWHRLAYIMKDNLKCTYLLCKDHNK